MGADCDKLPMRPAKVKERAALAGAGDLVQDSVAATGQRAVEHGHLEIRLLAYQVESRQSARF